jgi:hypothetical protein
MKGNASVRAKSGGKVYSKGKITFLKKKFPLVHLLEVDNFLMGGAPQIRKKRMSAMDFKWPLNKIKAVCFPPLFFCFCFFFYWY